MSSPRKQSSRNRFCRPALEGLEERCLLDATQNVFQIASSVYQNAALLGVIQANLPALAANPQTAPSLRPVTEALGAQSQDQVTQLENTVNEVQNNVAAQVDALEQVFNQNTAASIKNLNDQVVAIQNSVNALPPAQRPAAIQAVAEHVFQLQEGTSIQLKAYQDNLNGQVAAVVTIGSGFSAYTLTLAVKAEQNAIEATVEDQEEAVLQSQPIPGSGGGNLPGLITNHSPFHDLNIVPVGSDPRFPDSIISVGEYNGLIQSGQPVPNVVDPAPNEF